MPRFPRYVLPGQPQHVIQRGNNRTRIFISDEDYYCFRDILKEACEKHGCNVYAWIFMTNHIHLLLTPREGIRCQRPIFSNIRELFLLLYIY